MTLRLWFQLSAAFIGLALLGNFWLMWGLNPFHAFFWLLGLVALLELWAANKAGGWRGDLRALVLASLLGLTLPLGAPAFFPKLFDLLSNVRFPPEDWGYPIVLNVVIAGIIAGLALGTVLARAWQQRKSRESAEEHHIEPKLVLPILGIGCVSVVVNLVLLGVLGVVLISLPETPYQPRHVWKPGTAEQQAAYREYMRWIGGEYTDQRWGGAFSDRWRAEMMEPTPGIPEELLAPTPKNRKRKHGNPLVSDMSTDESVRFWRFCQELRPLAGPDLTGMYLPDEDLFYFRCQSTRQSIETTLQQNRPGQAALDYIQWGRGLAGSLETNSSLEEIGMESRGVGDWVLAAPLVLPVMGPADHRDLAQTLAQMQKSLSIAQEQFVAIYLRDLEWSIDSFQNHEDSAMRYLGRSLSHPRMAGIDPLIKEVYKPFNTLQLGEFFDRFTARMFLDKHATMKYAEDTVLNLKGNIRYELKNLFGVFLAESEKATGPNHIFYLTFASGDVWGLQYAVEIYFSPGQLPPRAPLPQHLTAHQKTLLRHQLDLSTTGELKIRNGLIIPLPKAAGQSQSSGSTQAVP